MLIAGMLLFYLLFHILLLLQVEYCLVYFDGNFFILLFQYQSDFPTSMKGAVFIDLGVRYKLMAEEILQRQIQLVKHNLMEVIFLNLYHISYLF